MKPREQTVVRWAKIAEVIWFSVILYGILGNLQDTMFPIMNSHGPFVITLIVIVWFAFVILWALSPPQRNLIVWTGTGRSRVREAGNIRKKALASRCLLQ